MSALLLRHPLGGCRQLGLCRLDEPAGIFEVRDEAVEWGVGIGEPADQHLQPVQDGVQARWLRALRLHVATVSATLPRMPFTNRLDSSPPKVLASPMDSLIAARIGILRATAISYTAIRRMIRSTRPIWSTFQLVEAAWMAPSSCTRFSVTPRTSSSAN